MIGPTEAENPAQSLPHSTFLCHCRRHILTEAGYVGRMWKTSLKLIQAADYDVEKAERGSHIDEIDKVARNRKSSITRMVGRGSAAGPAQDPGGDLPRSAAAAGSTLSEFIQIDTSNILFICGGPLTAWSRSSNAASKSDRLWRHHRRFEAREYLKMVLPEDLLWFGLIPNLWAACLSYHAGALDEATLVRILKEPKNALVKQYQKLMEMTAWNWCLRRRL